MGGLIAAAFAVRRTQRHSEAKKVLEPPCKFHACVCVFVRVCVRVGVCMSIGTSV